MSDSTNQAL
jgi:hypothetical protein